MIHARVTVIKREIRIIFRMIVDQIQLQNIQMSVFIQIREQHQRIYGKCQFIYYLFYLRGHMILFLNIGVNTIHTIPQLEQQQSQMGKMAICISFITVVLSSMISPDLMSAVAFTPNLQFGNYTGACITQDQINMFKGAVIAASMIYAEKSQVLAYIKRQMDAYQGNAFETYVVIMQEGTADVISWAVHSLNNCSVATLQQLNPYEPTWSFLFTKVLVPISRVAFFASGLDETSGFSIIQVYNIRKAIQKYEPSVESCDCIGTRPILDELSKDSQEWNVICSDSINHSGYLAAKYLQWLHTKGKRCYYFIYVI